MEPVSIILVIALAAGYFGFYRPVFILKPARKRKELVAKFEQATLFNQQLLADLQQYAQQNNLLDKPFMEGDTFRKKIAELDAARQDVFEEDRFLRLRASHPKNLDLELLDKILDDQLIYHQRIQKALGQYKAGNGHK